MCKIAIWEGKQSRRTSSLPLCICEVPIPLTGLTLMQKRLCILDEENVGAPTVQKQIRLFFMALFTFSLFLPLFFVHCINKPKINIYEDVSKVASNFCPCFYACLQYFVLSWGRFLALFLPVNVQKYVLGFHLKTTVQTC